MNYEQLKMNEKHPSSPGNMEAPGKSNTRVPQHVAKTHGKWHVPAAGERGWNAAKTK